MSKNNPFSSFAESADIDNSLKTPIELVNNDGITVRELLKFLNNEIRKNDSILDFTIFHVDVGSLTQSITASINTNENIIVIE